jgi:hypothetical protein
MREGLKTFFIFGGWMVPLAAVLLVRDSEWFKEWEDPHAYWSAKVSSSENWLKEARETVSDCTKQLADIRSDEGRRIWTAARKLEGKSDADAAHDYAIEVQAQEYACNGMKKLLGSSERLLASRETEASDTVIVELLFRRSSNHTVAQLRSNL